MLTPRIVSFVPALPRAANGKLRRVLLRRGGP
jgi:acyl-coenzyme A synthetase/AMP-(fatty) acid ligase